MRKKKYNTNIELAKQDSNIKEFKPSSASLLNSIKREDHFITKNTLRDVNYAIADAELIDTPNRLRLLELYHDIIRKDAHLKSVIKTRKERIRGLDFSIVKKSNGKIDETTTAFFKQRWFSKFLSYVIDAMFYGNSLIEILNDKGNVVINLIPRENVIPEFTEIKENPYSLYGDKNYSLPIYAKNLVDVNNENDSRNLGEFLSIVSNILMKYEVALNWSQYIEKFAQPLTVATTDTSDPIEMQAIYRLLADMNRSGILVKNSGTLIEYPEASGKGSSNDLYKAFEQYIDEQTSKCILGGTMTTDNGSSRSQAEVHERASFIYTKADKMFIEDIVNNDLIPLLRNKNMITSKEIVYRIEEPEIQTTQEKLQIDQFLIDNFKIKNVDYFSKRWGTDVEYNEEVTIEPKIDDSKKDDMI